MLIKEIKAGMARWRLAVRGSSCQSSLANMRGVVVLSMRKFSIFRTHTPTQQNMKIRTLRIDLLTQHCRPVKRELAYLWGQLNAGQPMATRCMFTVNIRLIK